MHRTFHSISNSARLSEKFQNKGKSDAADQAEIKVRPPAFVKRLPLQILHSVGHLVLANQEQNIFQEQWLPQLEIFKEMRLYSELRQFLIQ